MKSISEILQSDYLQDIERQFTVVERDWHQWLSDRDHDPDAIEVLSHYAARLVLAGVDLSNFELIDTITSHIWYLESAILDTIYQKNLDNATGYLIQALHRRARRRQSERTRSRLPIYRASDRQPEPSPPPPGYFESVKQMLHSKRTKNQ